MLAKTEMSNEQKTSIKIFLEKTDGVEFIRKLREEDLLDNLGYITSHLSRYRVLQMREYVELLSHSEKAIASIVSEYPKWMSFYESGDGYACVAFLNAFVERYPAYKKDLDQILEKEKTSFLQLLFSSATFICENPYLESLTLLVEELLTLSNRKYTDIVFMQNGGYSSIYRIGDFILKIGERCIFQIPSHPRLLKPIFRRQLNDAYIDVEVTRYVEPLKESYGRIPTLKSFSIFCELMEDGILWLDPKEENLGKIVPLENPDNFQLFVDNASIGIEGNDILEQPIGSYVILDLDFLTTKENYDETKGTNLYKEYLKCYQQLKERQENERHK